MSKLKPCPFCGGEARVTSEYDSDGYGKLSSVEPVVRLAIASGSNPDLWHIMDSAAITQDDVLRYYELTKV